MTNIYFIASTYKRLDKKKVILTGWQVSATEAAIVDSFGWLGYGLPKRITQRCNTTVYFFENHIVSIAGQDDKVTNHFGLDKPEAFNWSN